MAVDRAASRRSRACAPALALLGLALGGLLAPCFDAASPQLQVAQPKRPVSSYMLWMNENRGRIKSELGTNDIGQVGKEAGRQWGEIDAGVKSEYEGRAAALKREYEVELEKFLAAGGEVAKVGKKSKAKKDPSAPKKPTNAYMLWLKDNRQQIIASLPADQQGAPAVAKAAGVQWKAVSKDEKRKYQDLLEAAKAEYQKQLEEYEGRAA